jgi:2-dehydro-3-deoxyphosphogluconate aldolase/(4S)-4-hydroxy-2-oxoglutarate aldolase
MPDLATIMSAAPVIPVLTIDDAADAAPLAEVLVASGLPVLEVTFRTPAALAAIRAMAGVPGAIVGAGTVTNPDLYAAAADAGAAFAVSPGLTGRLAAAAARGPIPLLPGVATASEIMAARDHGFARLKFFPAAVAGGIPALDAFAPVFGEVRFCPTGGITEGNAQDWLALPNVDCVGGSWIVPKGGARDLPAVAARARAAATLRG